MVERNEMVEQILSRVMEKLAAAGETVTETELMQSLASAAAPLPGLLVLTQEHGTDCISCWRVRGLRKSTVPAVPF